MVVEQYYRSWTGCPARSDFFRARFMRFTALFAPKATLQSHLRSKNHHRTAKTLSMTIIPHGYQLFPPCPGGERPRPRVERQLGQPVQPPLKAGRRQSPQGRRFFNLLRLLKWIFLYTRYTFLWFQGYPSCRNLWYIFSKPSPYSPAMRTASSTSLSSFTLL